ncbi:uncharacterized protein MONOS_15565 [Monocercomonoides exilis]|uniref:uncharacterized protein n=1 Tax=Monocercomonoides exilis TaxID=2049356 RepID=UPI00355A8779|nr:hypothetical protein MONOS_15565 [Monocercomonoides exilis]|eukprot:MONOS_15565.1-p1 / transcript=MONOS_15565.1 / gene=MONOS_15565 / organism=Monocercomonoides_exilis_PA203 / gene_product=unspecified product / transcript_product=unspecified product / location=Mono_scaffold01273:2529-8747(-) / protein_length=2072 / sequence_SO=supercontig / SO=protein_coding / is_pseudo=false
MPSDAKFLFKNCSCIANTGGNAAGAVTFHYPPPQKPKQCLLQECQFINNKVENPTSYGGAALCCTNTFTWMNGNKFITFCFFDGNTATNGRGNDVFFYGSDITQSPFQQCGSTTESKRVYNNGKADSDVYNSWLPIINQNKIVSNGGSDVDACGKTQQSPCATVEYALGCVAPFSDASLSLLVSTFTPTKTLTFRAPNTKITGNGTTATTIASSGIPQPQNSYSQSSQSASSFSSFPSSTSSSPDPSATSALFQQTQGSLTVSALAIAHNSSNPITPILFHLSQNSPSLNLNATTITGTTSNSITTPLFFLTAGSLALNHTAITHLTLNSQSIFHLTSFTAPLTLNSSNITHITSTATPASCVLSSATSPALSLSLANCTITNINSAPQHQQTATDGGCISFASSVPANTFSVSDSTFFSCCVSEDVNNGGKGGGIYLDCSLNEGGFQLSSISFSGCSATVGKNMFVKSNNLVDTMNTERFAFDCSGYSNDGNAFVGEDGGYGEMDLRVFLVSLKWMVVSVSTGGHDTLGCGNEKFPCESMKSGIDHIDRSGTVGERKVKVKDEVTIEDIYSFTDELVIDGCVNEGDAIKHKPIRFESSIKENSASLSSSVISSIQPLSFFYLKLQIPSQFVPSMNSLISSSGVLELVNCLFEIQSIADIVQYSLITTTTGSCTLKGCSLTDCSFAVSPLVMASSVLLENSNFSNIANVGSEEGGIARVTLKNDEDLVIKSTNASSCSLSSSNGKGGFLYLDCENCLSEKPFVFDIGVTFENNNAATGRNMFILANDLNTSVTNDSFKFDYLSMINESNLFVGSDDFHSNKDLFMFLIPYSSIEIFISSEGYDVVRCGSEKEPCFTMWKGMENMKKEIGNKTIQIEGSTIIRDSYNVSNYQIKKSVKMGEEDIKAILSFEKAIGSQLEYFMENDEHLELSNIQLQLTSGFDNSAKTIISNKNGELVISGCSFHSEAGVNNGFDCVFVDAIGGSVEVNDLSIESCNVGNSIFSINNAGVSCQLKNVRVKLLNESGGCLLLIKGSELTTKINEVGEEVSLNIDNSSFSGVKRSDNGASVLESKSDKKICLIVKESNITEDKAEDSEKGGAIFFTLGSSGSMNMIDSKITNCNCSISSGKGGGVYLTTDERGELNFSFAGMKLSSNTARVGNDIFIECFNITWQINERQFQFDLREGHYSRINAIYGIDECEYPSLTDLIGFVTIHQSDTIIVSSVNGSDDRQCGTNALPCDSIDYGLVHLASDILSLIFVVEKSVIEEEINLKEMSLSSKNRDLCEVEVKSNIGTTREALVITTGTVSLLRVNFVFDPNFVSQHESLISPEGGILEIMNCLFTSKQSNEEENEAFANIPFHTIKMVKGELQLDGCTISNLILHESALHLSSPFPLVIDSLTICNSTIETSLIDINECGQLTIKDFKTENISVEGNEESLISCLAMKKTIQLANCTMGGVSSKTTKGKLMKLENCLDVKMDSCIFDGSSKERNEKNSNTEGEMCRWEGSLVDIVKSSVMMKDTTISNSPDGGMTMSGGNIMIEKGEFLNNNPSIEGYPSLRRNILCSDSGTLNVMSLKGGDGWKDNTSLWMLNEGCNFEGIVSERDSSFFIPVLESVEAKEETDRMKLTFKGMLLVPCNLSFSVVKKKGEGKEIEHFDFDSNGFLSEREVEGSATKNLISNCGDEIEVSVHVLFGNAESPSSTNSFILKNASITPPKVDERKTEGGNKNNNGNVNMIEWSLFAFIGCVAVIIILLFVIVVVVVLLRRKLREAEKKAEEAESEARQIMEKIERRRENNGGCIEMSEMPSTLLEGMTSQIPLLIDNDEEDLPEPPSMTDGELNENDFPDLEPPLLFSEDDSAAGAPKSHSLNVISAKKPFREKEKKNIKTLHSVIHSVQGNFTLGTRAMDVVDGKEVVLAVAELFEHLISVDDERVEMMARQLCPYTIFVEEGSNEIFVLTEELEEEKQKEEMKRWKAPEIGNEDEEVENDGIEQAVVFTLGLILHEMTTGEVPLSECEAEEAQEMMRDGVRPLTDGIEGEEMVELIERMWGDEPDIRPTLGEVIQSLMEMAENDAE